MIQSKLENVDHQKTTVMENSREVRRSPKLLQTPKLEKEYSSPRSNRGVKLRDGDKATKINRHATMAQGIEDKKHSFPLKSSGHFKQHHQPWLNNRGAAGSDELVKHMSNVPGYLQRTERGDSVQEKALNFGVLDWRCLEKWTDNSKWVEMNGRSVDSPASSNTSSSSSMFQSSSQSCRSSGSSSLAQKNRSPFSKYSNHNSSSEEDHTQTLEEGTASGPISNLGITSRKDSMGCHSPDGMYHHSSVDGLEHKLDNSRRKTLHSRVISHGACQSPETRIRPSTVNNCETPAVKSHWGEQFQESVDECSGSCSIFTREHPADCPTGLTGWINGISGHHGSHRFSSGSTESGDVIPVESSRKSFSEILPSDDLCFAPQSPIAHSCQLPNNIKSSEWTGGAVTITLSERNRKHNESTIKPPYKLFAAMAPDKLGHHGEIAASPTAIESLPIHQSSAGLNGMTRNPNLKDGSSMRQLNLRSTDSPSGDRTTDSSKARRTSPMRKILDPFLKPKAASQTHPAQPNSFYLHQMNSCTDHCSREYTSSSCVHMEIYGLHQDGKHKQSSQQALLHLAWKNGLPLITFSVDESDTLTATRKECISDEDTECNYTFHYIHEIKKRSSRWINHGNKNKVRGLVTSVVGQMNVSSLRSTESTGNDCEDHFTVREFILFGVELRPTPSLPSDSLPRSEIAAIVVRIPEENTRYCSSDLLQSNNCNDLLKRKPAKDMHCYQPVGHSESGQDIENNVSSIVALLPSEVHGSSDEGKPSSLIERWKSGGSCDCGGWDVGCSLQIISDNDQERRRSCVAQYCCTEVGTHRVELFLQGGGGQENRTAFRMVAFKEGQYTVNFHPSISKLQAFAICVAILHNRMQLTGLFEVANSRQSASTEERCFGKDPDEMQREMPTNYVSYRPPLSPVGRA